MATSTDTPQTGARPTSASERVAADERYGEAGRSPRFDAFMFRIVLGFGAFAAAVPWPVWRVLTLLAAFVTMATSPHRRQVAWDNIRHVRGALPAAPIAWWLGAQQVAAHFRTVLATLRIGAMEPEEAGDFRIDGLERATPILGQRGIIVVAPHAGPYPVLGLLARTWLRDTGFQGEFAVVARLFRPFRSGALMDWFIDRFGRHGVTIIPVHETPTVLANKLKTILDANGVVVLLVDEPTPTPSLAVPFFDSAIRLPIGPARLARATGSVLLPVMAAWGRGRELRIVIAEPIEPSRSPAETLGQIGQAIERFVAGNFSQWSMLTPVWVEPTAEPATQPALAVPPGHAAADLHLHTPGSDGLCAIDDWLAASERAGLRVIAVTDHDHIATVAAWRDAAGEARARVLPGVELTARGRIVHLGVLFPDAVPTRLPQPGTPLPDLVRWARGIPGSIVILVHPLPFLWRGQLRRLAAAGLLPDAIESRFPLAGGRSGAIERTAERYGLAILGGTDAHMTPDQLGQHATLFPGESADDLVAAIRQRRTRAVSRPGPATPVPRAAYAWQALYSWLLPFQAVPGVPALRRALFARARRAAQGNIAATANPDRPTAPAATDVRRTS